MTLHVSEIGRERIWRDKRAGRLPPVHRVPVWHRPSWWQRLLDWLGGF
jgi:hypothetical protein